MPTTNKYINLIINSHKFWQLAPTAEDVAIAAIFG